MKMKKNLHLKVKGFDIYLGINKSTMQKQKELQQAYQNQLMRQTEQRTSFKQEYDLARLY